MGRCDCCGNEYDKSFNISAGAETHTFDCFECAIEMMAPECGHCGVKIIGHGLETGSRFYCCQSCAEASGIHGFHDRVEN